MARKMKIEAAIKNEQGQDISTMDQVQRFQEGDSVVISTDMGSCVGIVVSATLVDVSFVRGYHYTIHYVPRWDQTGKGGLTIVTGKAVESAA